MRIRLAIILIGVLFSGCTAVLPDGTPLVFPTASPAPILETYENSQWGFALTHPANWQLLELPGNAQTLPGLLLQHPDADLMIYYRQFDLTGTYEFPRGSGQLEPAGSTRLFQINVARQVLMSSGQPIAVYYGGGAEISAGPWSMAAALISRGDPLSTIVQTQADDILASIYVIPMTATPTPLPPTPSPPPPLPLSAGQAVELSGGVCFDLETGRSGSKDPACDFQLRTNPALEAGTLLLIPIPPARFAPAAAGGQICTPDLPGLDAAAMVLRAGEIENRSVCYQTRSGYAGELILRQLNYETLTLDYETSESLGSLPAPAGLAVEFLGDITIPDHARIAPGEVFTKTWQFRNSGTVTWTSRFALVFVSGAALGNQVTIPLGSEVAPGQVVSLSASLISPEHPGTYTGYWMLQSDIGQRFGLGQYANQPFYVIIESAPLLPDMTATPPLIGGNLRIMTAMLGAETAIYSGVCPVDIALAGQITTDGWGTFVYQLEAGSSTPGFAFTLPPQEAVSYSMGGRQTLDVSFVLTFSDPVAGWVRLNVVGPRNTVLTQDVPLRITCH